MRFKWDETISVKIRKFDDQHKKLIGYLNDLFNAMSGGTGKEQVGKTLVSLSNYTRTHFADEEKAMSTHAFPGYAKHKKEHDAFVTKLDDFQQKHAKGDMYLTIDIMEFLQGWLIQHIKGTDKLYSDYLNEKGVN